MNLPFSNESKWGLKWGQKVKFSLNCKSARHLPSYSIKYLEKLELDKKKTRTDKLEKILEEYKREYDGWAKTPFDCKWAKISSDCELGQKQV